MNRKIIIVEGYLASGKSTFACKLSQEINVLSLIKDDLKSALCADVPINSRRESSCFSAVTFNVMMHVVERFMEAGYPVIIEGNFVPRGIKKVNEAGIIKKLIDKYDYESLTYKFVGNTQVLYKRFAKREDTPEREQANKILSQLSYNDFDKWCHNLDNFSVSGKVVTINTTDFNDVDFENYIEIARSFVTLS